MYQIKNIVINFFLMLVPVGVTAQYQKAQEKAPLVNVPLENFASQQKVLFNFGWKFQLVTNENKNTDLYRLVCIHKYRNYKELQT
jgi:beta-galactosidase